MSKQQTLRYDAALEKLSQIAEANTKAVLSKVLPTLREQDWPFETTCELILHSAQGSRQAAATLAEDLLMKQEGMKWTEPQLKDYRTYVEKTLEKYRSRLENGDIDDFIKEASSISGDLVNMSANAQMTLGQRAGVKFARVPIHDAKVCEYCIMQASRGFVFASEAKAWAVSHQRCRCRVLPETAAKAVGYSESLYRDLYRLDQYLRQVGELTRRNLMQQLVVLRHMDKDFASSVFGKFSYDKGLADFSEKSYENLLPHEQKTVDSLVDMGYSPKVLAESDEDGVRSIDTVMNGKYVEWKNSEGASRRRVEKNLGKAKDKFQSLDIRNVNVVYTNYGSSIASSDVYKELMNRRRKFNGCLFISKEGTVKFIKGEYMN